MRRIVSSSIVLLAILGAPETEAFLPAGPAFGRFAARSTARDAMHDNVQLLAGLPTRRQTRSSGACVMQMMTDVQPRLAEPSDEMLKQALSNAEAVVKAAGGCIDSLSFGREWKEMFPTFPKEAFKGTRVTSFNKLLSVYGSDMFDVESTKKKEVKLYILKCNVGAEGKMAYMKTEKQLKELADSPLGVFFDIRGGRMRAGGARALPPNLASYTKLDELLDALEPNLVAFAGGVSAVSARDAVTALNNIKRLQYQARWPVQQSRSESFVRVFIDIATRGISTLSTKSVALLLNAIEAFSKERKGYEKFEKTLQAASVRLQTLAKGIEILLPLAGNTDAEEVFSAQAVAIVVTAYQRMGLRDEALFRALASVVKALPPEDFDAQALANIANSYVVCKMRDAEMFAKLADIANDLTPKNWNPTALSLFVNAVVKMGMTSGAQDKALLHHLAETQCAMYSNEGSRAFSSPQCMAQLLSALVAANVQHVRLFTCASVVMAEHIRLGSADPQQQPNLLLPQVEKRGSSKNNAEKGKTKQAVALLAHKRFMEQATGADLAIIAGALHDTGVLMPDLSLQLQQLARLAGIPAGNAQALAASMRAFASAPAAAVAAVPADAKAGAEMQEFLTRSFALLPASALRSPAPIMLLLKSMNHSGWKDGSAVTKLATAICSLTTLSASEKMELEEILAALNMPRHLGPAISHLKTLSTSS